MSLSRPMLLLKALRQLGKTELILNAIYRFGLRSGHYRRAILPPAPDPALQLVPLLPVPTRAQLLELYANGAGAFPAEGADALSAEGAGLQSLRAAADQIRNGEFCQFGAAPVPLRLNPPGALAHWTESEKAPASAWDETAKPPHPGDIKLIWEPARFGWAFTLGRAYLVTGDEAYPTAFWCNFEDFERANPPYLGPNWSSAQEVGLRLMAFAWCAQVFASSPQSTPARSLSLANAIAVHAARIPATLLYARSQNNNHLLTEAAALYTAGLVLPAHAAACHWLQTGRRWLAWCFTHQIAPDGEYIQHSSNYHRLMLQAALWVHALSPGSRFPGGAPALANLRLAAGWLLARLDPISGRVPNLGANDGALIFPLASADFSDYRPVAAAAARAFLGLGGGQPSALPTGSPAGWDEMSLWFGLPLSPVSAAAETIPAMDRENAGAYLASPPPASGILSSGSAWAVLRAVRYTSRPSHADQLHLDLWWRGLNITLDPGTYRYNAPPPWDNQLTSTLVHNTVSVDAREQMTRASRFLYLDWAAAELRSSSRRQAAARTSAYRRLGLVHERLVTIQPDERWLVQDDLTRQSSPGVSHTYRLHWLLPDWPWHLQTRPDGAALRLETPFGPLTIALSSSQPCKRLGLLRAGQLLTGDALASPTFGWYSPTYDVKIPALSLAFEVESTANVHFTTEFTFPPGTP